MPSLKYRHRTSVTALRPQIHANGRGGFIYPPYGTALQNRNRSRHIITRTTVGEG